MQSGRLVSGVSVVIISSNAETLDGLERYLGEAGISVRGTRSLDDACEMVAAARSVVLLFPDDFPTAKVLAVLTRLKRQRPGAVPVLVTKDAQRFAAADGAMVIPKPVWGWTLLDTVRRHLELTE
jgi:DNA-binding NtrC family response regulator